MNEINGFTFYRNYYELLDELNSKDKKEMLVAIVDYVFKDIEPEFTGMKKAIWNNIVFPINTSKKNSLRSKGNGAPIGNQNATKKTNQNQTEIKPKSNQKGNQKQTNNISISISNFLYIISNFNFNNNITKLLKEYLELRIKSKYSISKTIVNRLCNKLNQYTTNDLEKEEIIMNAINGNWKDFYPLKNEEKKYKTSMDKFNEVLDNWIEEK